MPFGDPREENYIESSNQRKIESQLLSSLSDKSKVACIFDEEDLDALIDALEGHRDNIGILSDKQESLIRDLNQLKKVTFNE